MQPAAVNHFPSGVRKFPSDVSDSPDGVSTFPSGVRKFLGSVRKFLGSVRSCLATVHLLPTPRHRILSPITPIMNGLRRIDRRIGHGPKGRHPFGGADCRRRGWRNLQVVSRCGVIRQLWPSPTVGINGGIKPVWNYSHGGYGIETDHCVVLRASDPVVSSAGMFRRCRRSTVRHSTGFHGLLRRLKILPLRERQ